MRVKPLPPFMSTPNPPQERIVLIDDNPNDGQLMRRVLQRVGYDVTYAESGEAGLKLIEELSPHCILVDYRMPGMDGYEVCRRLKSDPQQSTIPVLMLTGADSAKNLVEGLESGADDFVTKSSDIEVILARIRALLRVKAFQDRIVEQSGQMRRLYDELQQSTEKIVALNQRLNSDLQFARTVQEALLPGREYTGEDVEIRSIYIPSETLSGDFYDYFKAEDRLFIFLADVSGHGLAAAILVSLLKSYLHTETDAETSLARFMSQLNDFLYSASLPAQYATAQLFSYERDTRVLEYSNAAHPPFIHYSRALRTSTLHESPGHLLGIIPGMTFDVHQLDIGVDDLLFCYTDGLTDRRSENGEFYSIDRIAAILEEHGNEELSSVYARIESDAKSFSPTDDYKDDLAFILTRFC